MGTWLSNALHSAGQFLSAHWLGIVLAIVSLFILDQALRFPDAKQRENKSWFSAYSWQIIGLIIVLGWVMYFGKAFPKMGNIHWPKVMLAVFVFGFYAVLFILAQKKKHLTGDTMYQRGFWGSLCWSAGLCGWILFGFSWQVLALMLLGFILRRFYTIAVRERGVVALFEKRQYERPWWMCSKKYLDTGWHFMWIPFDFPGFDIFLIPHFSNLLIANTSEIPTKVETDADGKRISNTGDDIAYDWELEYTVGDDPEKSITLSDALRKDPTPAMRAKVLTVLKGHALRHTITDHLSKETDTDLSGDELSELITSIEDFLGIKIKKLKIMDPTPAESWRLQNKKLAASDMKRRESLMDGRGEGAKAGAIVAARIAAVRDELAKPGGPAALERLIDLDRVNNTRTIVVDPRVVPAGAAAAAAAALPTDDKASAASEEKTPTPPEVEDY